MRPMVSPVCAAEWDSMGGTQAPSPTFLSASHPEDWVPSRVQSRRRRMGWPSRWKLARAGELRPFSARVLLQLTVPTGDPMSEKEARGPPFARPQVPAKGHKGSPFARPRARPQVPKPPSPQQSPDKRKKPHNFRYGAFCLKKIRQRPTLPHRHRCCTIGSEELNFRVRDGIGWNLFDITTGKLWIAIATRILRTSVKYYCHLRGSERRSGDRV